MTPQQAGKAGCAWTQLAGQAEIYVVTLHPAAKPPLRVGSGGWVGWTGLRVGLLMQVVPWQCLAPWLCPTQPSAGVFFAGWPDLAELNTLTRNCPEEPPQMAWW